MAGTITHEWNGTVLTITSDSGTSSMNLKGDTGMRGVQGRAGIILNADGTINMNGYATEEYVNGKIAQVEGTDLTNYATKSYVDNAVDNVSVDLSDYYTKTEVDAAIDNVDVDLTGYATETYVGAKIAAAQLEGAGVDMTPYVTKDDLDEAVANAGSGVGASGAGVGAEIFNKYDGTVVAEGNYSHAEGIGTWTKGIAAHAEGSTTRAFGGASHAEGSTTQASGDSSHAEGELTQASGRAAHAEGVNTRASSDYQHVQGSWNIEDKEGRYVHIVGNGNNRTANTGSTRSNAHTLDWNGNAWFAGNVYVGGTSMDDAVMLGSGGSGGSVNLSNYYTKTEVNNLINEAIANLPVYNGEVV